MPAPHQVKNDRRHQRPRQPSAEDTKKHIHILARLQPGHPRAANGRPAAEEHRDKSTAKKEPPARRTRGLGDSEADMGLASGSDEAENEVAKDKPGEPIQRKTDGKFAAEKGKDK